ncbi:MAG: response regulator [Bdellovibrionales bacterium]|nr:response regulator [Bdellovibrionales bacterium]
MREALSQVVSSSILTQADYERFCDVELYVKAESKLGGVLAEQVAHRISLEPSLRCHVPSKKLVARCGLDPEIMRREYIIPQRPVNESAEYRLVAADPWRVSIKEFSRLNVDLAVGLPSIIGDAWNQFFNVANNGEQQLSVVEQSLLLEKLIADCEAVGATSLLLGFGTTNEYECRVGRQVYTGNIHPSLYESFSRRSSNQNNVRVAGRTINIKYHPNGGGGVTLTWGKNRPIASVNKCESVRQAGWEVRPSYVQPSGKVILLIEDDDRFSLVLSKLFTSKGYSVVHKSSGMEAIDWLNETGDLPILVVCDVHMPKIDGIEFTVEIRKQGVTVPVLMLTSDDSERVDLDAAAGGADAIVRKCANPEVLLAWSQNLICRGYRTRSDFSHAI